MPSPRTITYKVCEQLIHSLLTIKVKLSILFAARHRPQLCMTDINDRNLVLWVAEELLGWTARAR